MAAKNRGHYFATSTPGHIEISPSPQLNIDLTISSWIRLDVLNSTNAIFAHDSDSATPLQILNFSITSAGKLRLLIGNPTNSYNGNETVDSSSTIPAKDWKFVAASIQLRADAISNRIKFNIDATEDSEVFTSQYYFLDKDSNVKTTIGASRNGNQSSGFNSDNPFKGFIYGIWVENVY